jgi:hypothetical protein
MTEQEEYLEELVRILWSYIPESDYELNEKISKEIMNIGKEMND